MLIKYLEMPEEQNDSAFQVHETVPGVHGLYSTTLNAIRVILSPQLMSALSIAWQVILALLGVSAEERLRLQQARARKMSRGASLLGGLWSKTAAGGTD